jgi:hypothetical protein
MFGVTLMHGGDAAGTGTATRPNTILALFFSRETGLFKGLCEI